MNSATEVNGDGESSSDAVKSGTTFADVLLHQNEDKVKIPEERDGAWIDFRVLKAYMGPAVRSFDPRENKNLYP